MSIEFTVENKNTIQIFTFTGNIISSLDFEEITKKVDDFLSTASPNFIFDLKNVAVINSLGLNGLIKTFTKCRNAGGELYIVNISDKINHVLMLTKLNAVLNIATSVLEAEQNILHNNES